jgi:hypothetical protein
MRFPQVISDRLEIVEPVSQMKKLLVVRKELERITQIQKFALLPHVSFDRR